MFAMKLSYRYVISMALAGLVAQRAIADELIFADRATSRVIAFDAATGDFSRVIVAEGLSTPSALTIGGGFLYVGDASSGQVLQVDLTTLAPTVVATIGGVGGLAYDTGANPTDPADDSLLVSEFGNFDGDEVYRFSTAGVLLDTLDGDSSDTGRSGLAIRDGDVYVSKFGEGPASFGSVLKYAGGVNGEPTTVASDSQTLQTVDPTLNGANGIDFDAAGNLYVAGLASQNIMKFEIAGGPDDSGTPFGLPFYVYPSDLLIAEENGVEVMYVTTLGNDNPTDPIYGSFLQPGGVFKLDLATGMPIPGVGGNPAFISSGGASDHNNDGAVDVEDLEFWQAEYGATAETDADGDGDGDADGNDFLVWQRNVGRLGDFQPTAVALYRTPVEIAAAVPEPGGCVLLVAAGAGLVGVRRRRLG